MERRFINFSLLASVGLFAFGCVGCSGSTPEVPAVSLSYSSLDMNVGETKQIKVSVSKEYANFPVRWFTNNENVAFFRDKSVGYVTAVGEGSTTVTAAIGGAFADCVINVTSTGGDPDAARFTMTSTMDLTVGDSKKLSYSVNPAGSTITFVSSAPTVADVNTNGVVTALAVGSATITATAVYGESSIKRECVVTISESGGGGGEDLSDDIPADLTFPADSTLMVGSPDNAAATMQRLIDYFKQKTGITANWTISKFEEGKGVGNFPKGAESGPDVFPYVSDQTMALNNLGALNQIDKEAVRAYRQTMLDGAITAATWNDVVLGYPFAADNGVVMFYDKQAVPDASDIDTVEKLFAKANEKGLKVGYALTNGFYGAGILHTFNKGQSMFKITATNTSYTSSSTFNCENGIKGLELAHKIMNVGTGGYGNNWTDVSKKAPGTSGMMATIIDTSNVREFRETLGDRYGVAPVPYVDETRSERLCTYLGYKFYGVNGACTKKTLAHAFAKFLASEYAQDLRFKEQKTQPTLKSLQHICVDEPHIAALNAQKASGSTLLLSIFGDEYFNNTTTTLTDLLNDYSSEGIDPSAQEYSDMLKRLDSSWK